MTGIILRKWQEGETRLSKEFEEPKTSDSHVYKIPNQCRRGVNVLVKDKIDE